MSLTALEMLEIIEDSPAPASGPAEDRERGFGALRTSRGNLPLRAMDVQGRIDALIAQVTLSQTFVNPFDVPLEATYVFPLPDQAAVTEFRMEVAGRTIEGILKERGQARRDYRQAIQDGKRAALAEEERPDVFTMTVGNLMPQESATVRLTMAQPLPYADGEATFRFPLVVGERYIPGSPLPGSSVGSGVETDTDATPDASRITPARLLPGFPNPVRLNIEVTWNFAGLRAQALRSSLHAVRIFEDGEGEGEGESTVRAARIRLGPGERLDRDFVLRARLASDSIQTSLFSAPDEDGEHETFLLTVLPPESGARRSKPRDLVFLIDRSGSMGGWKIVAARRALERIIETLTERDRFHVMAFDDRVEVPPPLKRKELRAADHAARTRVCRFLSGLDARGGTEMAQPLSEASEMLAAEGVGQRDSILTIITDGEVGNEGQLLKTLGKKAAKFRIFSLGIGSTLNMGLLQRLSAMGGGRCETVESEPRLEETMDRIHRQIGSPVLKNLRLSCEGLEEDTVVPDRLPDLFDGIPLVVFGRVRRGTVRIAAIGTEETPDDMALEMEMASAGSRAIRALWARGQIRKLEDRLESGLRIPDLERLIVETSLKFGVLSRFTSFVAVDHDEIVNPGGWAHHVAQSVEPTQIGAGGAYRLSIAPASIPQVMSALPPAPFDDLDDDLECGSDDELPMMDDAGAPPASAPPPARRMGLGGIGGLFGGIRKSRQTPAAPGRPASPSPSPSPSQPAPEHSLAPLLATPGLTAILILDHDRILFDSTGRTQVWDPPAPLSPQDLAGALAAIAARHGLKMPTAMNASRWRKRAEPADPILDWTLPGGVRLIAIAIKPGGDSPSLAAAIQAEGGIAAFADSARQTPGGLISRVAGLLAP